MSRHYVVARAAAFDLTEIARYTTREWGAAKRREYIGQLEEATERLAKGEGVFRDAGFLYPDLRMALCGHHFIFCLPRADALPLVVAILHERMDLIARLKTRWG